MAVGYIQPESGSDHFVPCQVPQASPKMACVRDGDHAILTCIKEFICNGVIAHRSSLYLFRRGSRDSGDSLGKNAFYPMTSRREIISIQKASLRGRAFG